MSTPKGEWKPEDVATVGELLLDMSIQLARTYVFLHFISVLIKARVNSHMACLPFKSASINSCMFCKMCAK